jgi:YidC/Oxa1 family membrane protein insertase
MDGGGAHRAMPSFCQRRLRSCSLTCASPAWFHWRPDINLSSVFDVFLPIQHLWEAVFVNNLSAFLQFLYDNFQSVPMFATIGAYGLAIVALTIGIRLVLAPLQQFQLVTQRKSMLEQRKLAPQVGELRKQFKKDPQRLNSEMQKLYAEHGINPFAGLVGCLPLIVQIPILTALYWVFLGFANHAKVAAHFLFIPDLNANPLHHLLMSVPAFGTNIGIPSPEYLVFPLLAAVTTFVQTKMLQMPPMPNPTEQELQTQQMQKMMVWMSPLMIGYFALNVPAGLGLYWFIGNCVGIIQQYFVVGWGNLLPKRNDPGPAQAVVKGGGGGPKPAPGNYPKPVPANGPRNGSQNGRNRKKRRR